MKQRVEESDIKTKNGCPGVGEHGIYTVRSHIKYTAILQFLPQCLINIKLLYHS